MILISTAILGLTLLSTPQGADQRAEAERMAKSGNYAAALKQFQALAAANPDDIEARLWIARLHAQMGQPEHAVDIYRSVLAVQPQHVEALVGVGESLVKLGRLKEASDALNRAEALAADRPAVLAAQGQRLRSRITNAPLPSILETPRFASWPMLFVQSEVIASSSITTSSISTPILTIHTSAHSN